ncbi:MAG: MotA/TolQ/ExbB proton channel family protein [Candidatus Kapabacteria bacterium]|nr:MotA/TolQ/ExbB proton channel family protein [Ignavibacteriota bacterium]MCW5885785.1 MotA/TolQ/ExbB proton channel family protein [Candidatus Kapabacteria bacterium]
MKGSTLTGIIIGTIAILGSFLWEGGKTAYLFLLPPMVIVIVGTLAAGLAGHSFEVFRKIPLLIKITMKPPEYDIKGIILQIVNLAAMARREGLLSLENQLKNVKHPYLGKLLENVIDGADPEALDQLVDNELHAMTERHLVYIGFFNKLGGYSPTMGIIGTVMGLIATLASVGSEPEVLIANIASAFIATLWGIFMANIVWLPVADKLRFLHDEEMKVLNIIINGIKSMQKGEIPLVIHAKLVSALPLSEQKTIIIPKIYKDEAQEMMASRMKDGSYEPSILNSNERR